MVTHGSLREGARLGLVVATSIWLFRVVEPQLDGRMRNNA
jgi:hypothetical protein